MTKNEVDGTLNFKGFEEEVTGTAWIDRQYGNFNTDLGERYEWFYLNLSNGMDVSIANIYTADRRLPATKDWRLVTVYVDTATQYSNHLFNLERLEYEYMLDSVTCYAQKWHLTSPENQLDLFISAVHPNNEVQVPVRFYEGSVLVSGTTNGKPVDGIGYAELLVSYSAPQIEFNMPSSGTWGETVPLHWHLQDPDDGRPVLYDLEYSTDNGLGLSMIESGLVDTMFIWENPPMNEGDSVWFILTAYSVDTTLVSEIITDRLIYYPAATSVIRDPGSLEAEFPIKLYPNPASYILNIESKYELTGSMYDVFDYTGRKVISNRFTHNREGKGINIQSLPGGYYLLHIKHDKGQLVKAFVKE